MPYNRHRRDSNHGEIVEAFRSMGCSVLDMSQIGKGAPDLLVGCIGNHLVELKSDGGKVSDDQVVWAREWNGGAVHLCWSVETVPHLVNHWRGEDQEVEVIEPDQFRKSGVI